LTRVQTFSILVEDSTQTIFVSKETPTTNIGIEDSIVCDQTLCTALMHLFELIDPDTYEIVLADEDGNEARGYVPMDYQRWVDDLHQCYADLNAYGTEDDE
jgi:hypothetical protein